MSGISMDFLGLLGILFSGALVVGIALVVFKKRRLKRLMDPRKDFLKKR